jgi:ABC-type sugar transport system ATPase subunit
MTCNNKAQTWHASSRFRNVVKRYGTGKAANQVIHGVNAPRSTDGEFVVIVGPSGCGKSTLLRMVAGLEEISGGEISIGGRVVNQLEPAERDIAMVFQNYALYPHMSVFDNMAYGLKIAKVPKDEIKPAWTRPPRSWSWALAAAQAARTLGRPAPARGHGPRHRAPAAGVSV